MNYVGNSWTILSELPKKPGKGKLPKGSSLQYNFIVYDILKADNKLKHYITRSG
jgi:hypothetical protein